MANIDDSQDFESSDPTQNCKGEEQKKTCFFKLFDTLKWEQLSNEQTNE